MSDSKKHDHITKKFSSWANLCNFGIGVPKPILSSDIKEDITTFFDTVSHLSINDSYSDEGLETILNAFTNLLNQQKCYNALHSLKVLQEEKGPNAPFRANGKTPNILHEIRNCSHILGMILAGYIPMGEYATHGGLDADLSARLRHDSIEDRLQTKLGIFADLERNLNDLCDTDMLDTADHYAKRIEATLASENIDLMTRKDAVFDGDGRVVMCEGKIVKEDRYNGDVNIYYYRLMNRPTALLCKYHDSIENVGTRLGGTGFSTEKNIAYARERREIYGLEDYDERATEKWPGFELAIRAADDMLGIQLVILEGVNKYMSNPQNNPKFGAPFRFSNYIPHGLQAFKDLPNCFHPVAIAVHSIRSEAQTIPKLNTVLDKLIIPPLYNAVKQLNLKSIAGVHNRVFPEVAIAEHYRYT